MTRTIDLEEAAEMLKTTPDTVSECIKSRGLPAARIGRAYVLIEADVIEWLRTQYGRKAAKCDSTNEARPAPGGSISDRQAARDLWRQQKLGAAPRVTWDEAALAWLADHEHLKSIDEVKRVLRWATGCRSGTPLSSITPARLKALAKARREQPANAREIARRCRRERASSAQAFQRRHGEPAHGPDQRSAQRREAPRVARRRARHAEGLQAGRQLHA